MNKFSAGVVLGMPIGLLIQAWCFDHYIVNQFPGLILYYYVERGMLVNCISLFSVFILSLVLHHWLKKFKFYRELE